MMMKENQPDVVEYKPRDNKLKIVVSSQTRVRGFYESLGFVAEGKEYLDQFCPHIKMVYTIELKE